MSRNYWRVIASMLVVVLFVLAGVAQKATKAAPPTSVAQVWQEPNHHFQFANDYVQAYYIVVAPHGQTLMHRHPDDFVAYAVGQADLDIVLADGKTSHVLLNEPMVRYTPCCVTHTVKNRLGVPFLNITIELLKNHGAPVCVGPCENDPRAKKWPPIPTGGKVLGYGDTFRMAEMVLAPGETTNQHTHTTTHLMAAITPVTLKSHVDGQPDLEVHKEPRGDAVG
jgi:quercetin dioxygenase-like cupin family protein